MRTARARPWPGQNPLGVRARTKTLGAPTPALAHVHRHQCTNISAPTHVHRHRYTDAVDADACTDTSAHTSADACTYISAHASADDCTDASASASADTSANISADGSTDASADNYTDASTDARGNDSIRATNTSTDAVANA